MKLLPFRAASRFAVRAAGMSRMLDMSKINVYIYSMTSDCGWLSRLRRPVFLWWTAAFAAQLAVDWFQYREPVTAARSYLVMLPALMWIFVIGAFVRAVFKSDELQQRIHLQAVFITFVLAAILILVFSGLERAGIYRATLSVIGGSLMLLLMISFIVSAWRYR
jgi:hypothetical protein